jgi:hypothetical protein
MALEGVVAVRQRRDVASPEAARIAIAGLDSRAATPAGHRGNHPNPARGGAWFDAFETMDRRRHGG